FKQLIQASYLEYNIDLEQQIIDESKKFEQQYASAMPFQYYFLSRIKHNFKLIFNNVTQDWPTYSYSDSPMIIKIYKLGMLGFYWLICALGFIVLPFMIKDKGV